MAKIKDAYYFSHDSNARNDQKMLLLRAKYGYEGYGIFWAIIESMRDATDYQLNIKHISALSIAINVEEKKLTKFVEDCINEFRLFTQKDDNYHSLRLLNSMKKRKQLQSKMRANALQKHSKSSALKERKGKEIKVKEKKVNKGKSFIAPSLPDVKDYFKENGYPENLAVRAFNHYDIAGWIDAKGNPVKNWKQKMHSVWFTDENKIKEPKPPVKVDYENLYGEVAH